KAKKHLFFKMPEGKFFDHEIDFLRDEIDYNLPNGDIPSIQNMLEPEELKYYNTQSLEDKGIVNSDINFALQKGFRFLQPSPFGTPWNPKLKLEHVGLTIPYTDSENCLYDTVKTIMNNLSMPTNVWLLTSSMKETDVGNQPEYRSFYPSHSTCLNSQQYIRTPEERDFLLEECDDSIIREESLKNHQLDRFNFSASGVKVHKVLALEIEIYRLPEEGSYIGTRTGKAKQRVNETDDVSDEESAYYESLYQESGF
ncbi:unnamed protein product, partial [Oikopleura dioica]